VYDNSPVIYVDDRWLYDLEDDVPDKMYETPIGKAAVRRTGSDITIVAFSYLVKQAEIAADELNNRGISAEVIDLRTIKPLDMTAIVESLQKTGRLVICDPEWPSCNIAGTICAVLASDHFGVLKHAVSIVQFPDTPIGASSTLEKAFYPMAEDIIDAALTGITE
jgi:pyruvate dehydrogenase E1 component beta subunit